MSVIQQFAQRSSIVGEVFSFMWQRKLWWLTPLAVLILLIGILFVLAQVSSVAPWMYPV
jgi:beta-lactamase regulating signal transducer with metallopeptidase domain